MKTVQTRYTIPGTFNALGLSPTDTIIVGNFGNVPTYRTHDKLHQLAPYGYGTSIALSGSDVYVGGAVVNTDGNNQAVYWKNDTMTNLKSPFKTSSVLGMAVAGTDLYAAGDVFDNGKYVPVYWKNGAMNKLGVDGTVYAACIGQEIDARILPQIYGHLYLKENPPRMSLILPDESLS